MKYVATINMGQSPPSEDCNTEGNGLPFLQGNAEFGERHPTARFFHPDPPKSCHSGDILLSVRAPVGALNVADRDYGIGRGLCAITPRADLLGQDFVRYFLEVGRSQLDAIATGSTYEAVSTDQVAGILCPVPSLSQQHAITTFLDRETARIDDLVAKKERLIELLEEKRAALITQAVTRGLDPSVPVKGSGVEWLGSVPEHWDLSPLRRVTTKFVDYRGATPAKVSSGVPLVTARNIKKGMIDLGLSEEFIQEDAYEAWMVRGLPEVGDLLLTTEAPLGECAQVSEPRIALAQRVILLKLDHVVLLGGYLRYYFESQVGRAELWSRATGSTALGIKASHLREVRVTVPPLSEQASMVTCLDRESERVGPLVAKIREAVEKLREYRAALISSAVTGRIDVQEGASSGSEMPQG